MSVFVVDASVAAKWFFVEEETEASARLLSEANRLHAPDFILLEMDSILCKRVRRRQLSIEESNVIRSAVRQVPLQLHPQQDLMDAAYEYALLTSQSPYDCLYLALAKLIEAKVVTADRRFYDGVTNSLFADNVMWVETITT